MLLYQYYRHKLQQLSQVAEEEGEQVEDEADGAAGEGDGGDSMEDDAGGGHARRQHVDGVLALPPGWAVQLQGVAACLRGLDLQVANTQRGLFLFILSAWLGGGGCSCVLKEAQPTNQRTDSVSVSIFPSTSSFLQALSEEAFAAVVCRHLREHLLERTQRSFDERILGLALQYSTSIPLQFLQLVLPQGVSE